MHVRQWVGRENKIYCKVSYLALCLYSEIINHKHDKCIHMLVAVLVYSFVALFFFIKHTYHAKITGS